VSKKDIKGDDFEGNFELPEKISSKRKVIYNEERGCLY
jgi:hypothetical protein